MISRHIWSQVVFYLGWIVMVFIETTLWSITGLAIGFLVFLLGGYLWALWHIANTQAQAGVHGPVLVVVDKMLAKSTSLAIAPSALLAGGPGVGLVLQKQASPHARYWSFVASLVYAATWCLIHAVRPQMGVPVRLWPSMELLHPLFDMF